MEKVEVGGLGIAYRRVGSGRGTRRGVGGSDDPPETFRLADSEADLRDVLPGIRVPTLLLYGDADRRSPLGTVAAELHRRIPGSRLRIPPEVGHAADMEDPEQFNAELRGFLRLVP